MDEVRIGAITRAEEYDQVVQIQRAVWGLKDIDLTPAQHFDISVKTGAILLGAFVGETLAGYVYSFPARHRNLWVQHSRQLAVLPRFRERSIGKSLKWAQRRAALEMGYPTITWTVEPLLSRNARLNFHTLGAVARTYLADYYRAAPDLSLLPGLPVDRLHLEWPLASSRVAEREKGPVPTALSDAAPALEKAGGGNPVVPGRVDLSLTDGGILIEIPRDIQNHAETPSLVKAWQEAVRRTMEKYFAAGYWIVDFVMEGGRCFYILRLPKKGEWDGI